MNFFEHQDRARRQSRWLLVVFTLAVAAIVVAVNGIVLLAVLSTSWDPTREGMSFGGMVRANWPLMAGTAIACIALIFLASLFRTLSLKSGGGHVARQLGGTQVDPSTRDPLRRRLYNVVEEISLASGVPVPEVYVLDREAGINAFAAGFTASDAAVAVTRGALEKLSRSELQGVIAHEFSHILNGDMRINIRLMGTLFGILVLALIGRRVLIHARWAGGSSRDRGGAIIVLIAIGLTVVGYIGLFFGRWIKAAVARQREYLADASAVQFTRDPSGIGGALKKIAIYSDASYLDTDTEEVSHMLFGDGRRTRLFSTHPPLTDRIGRIEPDFRPEDLDRLAAKIQHERIQAKKAAREKAQAAEGGGGPAFGPRGILERIGQPDFQQVLAAAALAAALPANVARAARSPEWAADVLFYALLDRDPEVRQQQLLIIAEIMGEDSEQRVRALHQAAGSVGTEQQLPLLELAFPQVRQRPPEYIARVLRAVKALAEADHRVDPFEFLLARSISLQLWETHNPDRVRLAGDRALQASLPAAAVVLAVLARHGQADDAATIAAFQAGWRELGTADSRDMPPVEDWVAALDEALPELDRLRPADKETLLRALIATAMHDARLEAPELELLRAVSSLIHVPLPLLSAGPRTSRRS
ncbi:MAG: M48 family metallopeptidase [Xanthomonadales bacterium]